MSKGLLGALGIGAVLALVLAAYLFFGFPEQTRNLGALSGDPVRGEYISKLAGCVACHTDPKAADGFLAGGLPIETPFGIFVGPNITPDTETGIGNWSLDDFAGAVINGRSPNGSHYYPVFPYASYGGMADQDLVDLWAYLQTVPARNTARKSNQLSFPFNVRLLMAPWKTLFLNSEPWSPNPDKSDDWNRGAYIVNALGHCGECHTPRGAFGNALNSRKLSGSLTGPGGEKVPSITAEDLTKAGWTTSLMAIGLKIGITPTGDFLGGSMGEVLSDSTSHYTDEDLAAVASYLFNE